MFTGGNHFNGKYLVQVKEGNLISVSKEEAYRDFRTLVVLSLDKEMFLHEKFEEKKKAQSF